MDSVVATVDSALEKKGLTIKSLEVWKADMPTEAEMLPKDKYTLFDRKAKRYRKGIHSKEHGPVLLGPVLCRFSPYSRLVVQRYRSGRAFHRESTRPVTKGRADDPLLRGGYMNNRCWFYAGAVGDLIVYQTAEMKSMAC